MTQFDAITSGNSIGPGQYLAVGQGITSGNGQFFAFLQESGQFVVRHNGTKTILYSSAMTPGKAPSKLAVGYTDNVVVWATDGTKIWESSKIVVDRFGGSSMEDDRESFFNRQAPGTVVLNDKGNMLMLGSNWPNHPVWSSDSGFSGFAGSVSELKVGEVLPTGQKLRSGNGDHELSLLPSGHLQLHNTVFNADKFYSFQPNTVITDASYLAFGRDLVLDLHGADGRSIWRAENKTPDKKDGLLRRREFESPPPPPPRFILDNDANVFVRGKGTSLWDIETLIMKKSLT